MRRKLTPAAVIALSLCLALAACEGGGEAESGKGPSPSAAAESRPGAAGLKDGRFDPPVTISTARTLRDMDKLKPGDTVENNPITRWAKDRLGIIQTNKWTLTDPNDALATKIRLALTGDEELPDVLFITDHDLPGLLRDLVDSGKIMDVGEAFERYASPRVKEAYEKNPGVWRTVQLDGKRWGLPQISDAKVGDPILWIRQDWLDKLQLKAPETLDELESVMDAFTNLDPDGNGRKDTIGLAFAGKNNLNSWMGNASFLFGAYGDQPYQWNKTKDGKLAYGSVQPEIKLSLARLKAWVEKGYIDKDFGRHDEQKAAALFTSGAAGIIAGPGWMGGWPLSEAMLPASAIKPLPFPAGPDGRIGRMGTKLSYGSYVFRKGFPHMDAAFLYWDRVYSYLIEDPASDFVHGFAEGYDYVVINGEPVYDFPDAVGNISNHLLVAPGSTPPHVMKGDSLERRVYNGQVNTPYEKRLAVTSSRLFLEGLIVSDVQLDYAQRDEYVGPNTPAMQQKWTLLKKLEKEAFLKIVFGKEPLDSFDAFVREWHRQGGNTVTEEVNRWYADTGRADR